MKSQKSNTRPAWQPTLSAAAVRRTFETAIMQAWKCDRKEAAREFDRALQAGELEEVKIGLSWVTAYKLKEV